MSGRLSIVSVCRDLPGPGNLSGGIFVLRRLAAMARRADLTTIQPLPWFPVAAPLPAWSRKGQREASGVAIRHAPMFYLPKVMKSLDGLWLYRSILSELRLLRGAGRADVVDAHFGYPEGFGALLAARRLGIPVFVTLRGFEAEYLRKSFIGLQLRHLLRRVDGCICVSQSLRQLALANGAVADRTCVIQNAIDHSMFFPGNRDTARTMLGLPTDVPIVISVGNLIARKRHHILIAAFAEVLRGRPDARLLIVGASSFERNYPQRLQDQVRSLALDASVSFLPNLEADRVGDYLRAADVFALATQREGCCNAVLEALACGLPVVTTPVGDNACFVRDGKNGYIVPVEDTEALAVALDHALERRDWDKEYIASHLGVGDWDGVAARVLDFFAERTGLPAGGGCASLIAAQNKKRKYKGVKP